MKVRFNSDDDLPVNRTLQFYNMMIFAKFIFHECCKYYPQILIDEYLYKLAE